jgi:hypothetical protein
VATCWPWLCEFLIVRRRSSPSEHSSMAKAQRLARKSGLNRPAIGYAIRRGALRISSQRTGAASGVVKWSGKKRLRGAGLLPHGMPALGLGRAEQAFQAEPRHHRTSYKGIALVVTHKTGCQESTPVYGGSRRRRYEAPAFTPGLGVVRSIRKSGPFTGLLNNASMSSIDVAMKQDPRKRG